MEDGVEVHTLLYATSSRKQDSHRKLRRTIKYSDGLTATFCEGYLLDLQSTNDTNISTLNVVAVATPTGPDILREVWKRGGILS
jgi:hypothetical protein